MLRGATKDRGWAGAAGPGWLLALAPLGLQLGTLPAGDDVQASVRVQVDGPETVYVGQRVELDLRIGFTETLLENLVPLSRRALDLPIEVQAPWLEPGADPGARLLPVEAEGARTLAVAGRVGFAEPGPPEGTWRWFVLPLELEPERPGPLSLGAPEVTLAHATRFREDLLHGRVPEDRREARILGSAVEFVVQPLPDGGRPPGFTGAVGSFSVEAGYEDPAGLGGEPPEVSVGSGVSVSLTIRGDAAVDGGFGPPSLEGAEGFGDFALRGWVERPLEDGRRFVFDLAPLSTVVEEVPAIPFAYFQPTAPVGWRVARTEPLPLRVLPAPVPLPRTPATPTAPTAIEETGAPATSEGGLPRWLLGLVVGAVAGGVAAAVAAGRARSR